MNVVTLLKQKHNVYSIEDENKMNKKKKSKTTVPIKLFIWMDNMTQRVKNMI